jgi:hypothetical protein
MEWFWIVVAAGGAGFTVTWWRAREQARRAAIAEFEAVQRLAGEDVDHLGEQVRRVGENIAASARTDETLDAYRSAVDAYELAKVSLSRLTDVGGVEDVTAAIAAGHHALARAVAQPPSSGGPEPEERPMCFFNPQHGPSTTDVLWTRPGHGQRRAPACSQDAQRLIDGLSPQIRTVGSGAGSRPYWSAGNAFWGYTRGYFASVVTLSWAFQPAAPDAAAATGRPGHLGSGITGSSGKFDGGGFDGSGAPD